MMILFSILSRDWNSELLSELDLFYFEDKYQLHKYMVNPQDYKSKHFRLEIVEIRIMSKLNEIGVMKSTDKKIDYSIKLYQQYIDNLVESMNINDDLSVDIIINKAEALTKLKIKITALEVAKNN